MIQIPIESLNLQMLNVGFARQNGDWNWQEVSSPFTRIYCVTEGEAWLHTHTLSPTPSPCKGEGSHPDGILPLTGGVREGMSAVHLTPDHLYIIPAYTAHSYECHGTFSHYYLHVYEGFKKESDIFEMYDFPTEVEAQEGDEDLMRWMCERHPDARLPESDPRAYDNTGTFADYVRRYNGLELGAKMWLRGAMLMLFSRFMERATPRLWTQDERMAKVLAHVHLHIYEDIAIETLAGVACVTKPYLIRLFKRDFGQSPLQYINRKKVERAQLLLLTDDMAVKEVAYQLGFADHSYFIRLFKKVTGRTPQEYREMFHVRPT